MTRGAASLSAASLLGALCACSALLPEIELDCDKGCDALNQRERIGPEDCYVYQCRGDKKGCELQPRDDDRDKVPDRATCADAGVEHEGQLDCDDSTEKRVPGAMDTCDGIDNDCDDVIDEDALNDFEFESGMPLTLESSPEQLSYAATDEGRLDLVQNDSQRFDVQREGVTFEIVAECAAKEEAIQACTFADIAVATTEKLVFAAGINTSSCPPGQVRVGIGRDWTDFSWQHSPASTLRFGIDPQVGAERPCAGRQGATGVRVGLFEGPETSRGLLLWRAANVHDREGRSPEEPADLRGILLALSGAPNQTKFSTTATAESELVSTGPGFESALVTWPDPDAGGFFIAYDAPGSIELGFIPHTAALRPLAAGLQRGMIRANQPRHVSLALNASSSTSDDLALAAAWRDGSQLHFAAIAHRPDRSAALQAGEVIPVLNDRPPVAGPVVVYQPSGFRTAMENGGTGGWYVLWLEQTNSSVRLRASRIARGQSEAERPFDVYEQQDIRALFAYPRHALATSSTQAMVAIVAGDASTQMYTGPLECKRQ